MATTQDLLTLKKKIERDAATYTKLYEKKDNGEDLTEIEVETAKRIENYLENLISQYKTLAALPASTNAVLSKVNHLVSQKFVNVFSYTPIQDQNKNLASTKRLTILRGGFEKAPYVKLNNVKGNMAVGTSTQSFGITDDLLNYTGQPTLRIQSMAGLLIDSSAPLYSSAIEDRYSVSFIFKLNRFPSKLHKNQNNFRQITTRRTDLLSFNYEGDSRIEFGAMAPFTYYKGRNKNSIIRTFEGNYNQFSIAANIVGPKGGSKSFYTDYKFELGKEYQVKLVIVKTNESDNNEFGSIDNYFVYMYVNNVLESIAMTDCKVWGQKGNFYKRNQGNMLKRKHFDKEFNLIATQPNFLPYFVPAWESNKFGGTELGINNNVEYYTRLGNFKFKPLFTQSKATPISLSYLNKSIKSHSFSTLKI